MCARSNTETPSDPEIVLALARAKSLLVRVGNSDENLHPAAGRTFQALVKSSKTPHASDRYGLFRPHWESRTKCIEVHVSLASFSRVARILDGILRACDEMGVDFKSNEERTRRGQELEFLGERFRLCMSEKVKQQPRAAKPGESEYGGKYDYEPRGILELQLLKDGPGSWPQRSWIDRQKIKLEDVLGEVIEAMVLKVNDARTDRAEIKQRENEQREAERVAAETKQRREDDLASARALLNQAEGWHAAEALRRYAAAVRTRIETRGPIHVGSEAAEWLAWAARTADRLDPMTSTKESKLELDALYPPPQKSWNGYSNQEAYRERPSWFGGWPNRHRR